MRNSIIAAVCCALAILSLGVAAFAVEPVTLENLIAPEANRAEEPFAPYSVDQAAHFLDSASLQWQKQRKCMTCHTNYAYLYARPAISSDAAAHREVRRFAEQLVNERWKDRGPRWDAEVIATAAALAYNDAATTGELDPTTRTALDRMWEVQADDGGWDWLKCGWPPMESDDHYGVTLAAIAVGVAPGHYAQTRAARQGMEKVRTYLKNHPSPTLHHQAMAVWAGSYLEGIVTPEQRRKCVTQLLALQQDDGGWAAASLGDWERADDTEQDLKTSDGYGTGFVLFVLRRAGQPVDSPAIERGVAWLRTHQRASGRWYSRSLHKDNYHFLTHAGSAMAIMALDACDALRASN